MKFSTRTTYGLRAIGHLVNNFEKKKSISLAQIAKKENISLAYLEQIFSKLKKDKLITSAIGSKGGYTLAKNPKKISVLNLVESLEGKLFLFHCLKKNTPCKEKKNCKASFILEKLQSNIQKTLKEINLKDLVK